MGGGSRDNSVASGRKQDAGPEEATSSGRRETVTSNGTTSERQYAAQEPATYVGPTFGIDDRSQEPCAPGEGGRIGNIGMSAGWGLRQNALRIVESTWPTFNAYFRRGRLHSHFSLDIFHRAADQSK